MPRLDQLDEDAYNALLGKMADTIEETLGDEVPQIDSDLLIDAARAVLMLLRDEDFVHD